MDTLSPHHIYHKRAERFQGELKRRELDAFLVEGACDLYYLTGLKFSAGQLIISSEGCHLLVDGRYIGKAQLDSPFPTSLLKGDALKDYLLAISAHTFGFDSTTTTYHAFERLKESAPGKELIGLDHFMRQLRAIKGPEEIASIKEACALAAQGQAYAFNLVAEGVTERAIARELEIFWLKEGAERLSFEPIVAFGPHSAEPHHRPTDTPLVPGEVVLLDCGVQKGMYQSDLTRVTCLGSPPDQIQEIYAIVKGAVDNALALLRPGATAGSIDKAARSFIEEMGYGESFTHSLGHGVGLEIHEHPTLRSSPQCDAFVLQANMVVTIEPGIYLPGIGGVRLEDTILITPSGYEILTAAKANP